ncbi:hypothetical protein CBC_A1241 [Clostridium botulinum C str. Eklund]|nr:hypothetical protein CBC_A1241 [Clostridium botulinum C str. Eklund]NEZ48173.1 hypothetical protein [Clostridium botulinum]
MNILDDKYILGQSQKDQIIGEGQEIDVNLSLISNNKPIFAPEYGEFIVYDKNIFPPITLNTVDMVLSDGATLNSTTGIIENLGTVTVYIDIPSGYAGTYKIQMDYLSGNGNSNVLISVNGGEDQICTFYSTYDWQPQDAYVFATNLTLVEGINVLKISPNPGKPTPWLGDIDLIILNSPYAPQFYTTLSKIIPPASILQGGFIAGIGVNGAYVIEDVVVPYAGTYNLNMVYLTGTSARTIDVDINGKWTGQTYNLPQSAYPWGGEVGQTLVTLAEGTNSIKFYTKDGSQGPWLGPVIIGRNDTIQSMFSSNATLKGTATIENKRMVYSGFGVGAVSFNVDVPTTQAYNLMIQYRAPIPPNEVYIFVNGVYIGSPVSFDTTVDGENKVTIVSINLVKGTNEILLS